MKKLLFILCILNVVSGAAQDFGSVETQWVYNDHENVNHQNFPRSILSIEDTVVNGVPCHIVIGGCACGTAQTNFVYGINRRAYWYNYSLNAFTLLYNFNLDEGDTWTVIAQNTSSDSLKLRVDSVSFDTINGQYRKVQHVSTIAVYGNAYTFDGPVIEGIGSTGCLYPQYAACDAPTAGLRCFEDSMLGFYDTHFAVSCEAIFTDSLISVNENEKKLLVRFAPNPLTERSVISLEDGFTASGTLQLIDVTGRIVEEKKFTGNQIVIERHHLDKGIYIYQMKTADAIASGKFIVD